MVKAAQASCKPNCKWCEKGECWTSGQIERPSTKVGSVTKKAPVTKKDKAANQIAFSKWCQMAWSQMGMNMQMGAGPQLFASVDSHPKSELNLGVQLLIGRPVTKQDILYESDNSTGKFVATVSIPELGREAKGKPGDSKKEAETSAAQKLLNQLRKQINEVKASKANAKAMNMQMGGASGESHPKSELNSGLPLLIGRPITKEDIAYEVENFDGKFVATVSIPELGKQGKGQPADSKKEAEASAAQKLLNQLKKRIDEAKSAHADIKRAKAQEYFAKVKELKEAKKAASNSV